MKANWFLFGLMLFSFQEIQSQVRYGGELYINGADGLHHNFRLQAIGMVWGPSDQDYPVTHEWDSYVLNNQLSLVVDHCSSPEPNGAKIGYGKYKLTVDTGYISHYINVDFRDCDYLDGNGACCGTNYNDPDIQIYFDSRISSSPFYYFLSGNPNPVTLSIGATFPIWHSTNKNPSVQNKVCFPPTVTINGPSSLLPGQTATFTANAFWINPPLSYQWFRRIECSNSDIIENGPKDTPCGKWYAFGGNTKTVQSSAWQDFSLKCVVTDAALNTAQDEHYIHVNTSLQQENVIVQYNYPNPFNSSTNISFKLQKDTFISITIYNVCGLKIRNIINEELPEGEHTLIWDGKDDNSLDVSSGVYYCTFTTGENNQVIKLFLIK